MQNVVFVFQNLSLPVATTRQPLKRLRRRLVSSRQSVAQFHDDPRVKPRKRLLCACKYVEIEAVDVNLYTIEIE